MIYEVRTYTLRPGTLAEFEERYQRRLPSRLKHSPLGAFWHTEFGPLNQVVHVYPYDDLQHRTRVRTAMAQDAERNALPGGQDLIVEQQAEIVIPAPFMRPLGSRDYGSGNVYEMRTYTYAPGDLPKVLDAWSKAIEARERFSPLAACWTSELGGLNRFTHIWVYKDLNERARIRDESRRPGTGWPPQAGVRPGRKISCSFRRRSRRCDRPRDRGEFPSLRCNGARAAPRSAVCGGADGHREGWVKRRSRRWPRNAAQARDARRYATAPGRGSLLKNINVLVRGCRSLSAAIRGRPIKTNDASKHHRPFPRSRRPPVDRRSGDRLRADKVEGRGGAAFGVGGGDMIGIAGQDQ